MKPINSGKDYAELVINNIVEAELELPKEEQMCSTLLRCWANQISTAADEAYIGYIKGDRESFMFDEEEFKQTFENAKSLRLKWASKLLPDQQLHVATQLVMRHKGYLMPDAVVTGAGMDADIAYQSSVAANVYQQMHQNNILFKEEKAYTTLTTTDPHYVPRLAINLNKAANNPMHSNVAKDILNYQKDFERTFKRPGELVPVNPKLVTGEFYNTPEYLDLRAKLVNQEYARMMASIDGKYAPYDLARKSVTRWKNGDIKQYAEDRVDKTLGMLIGRDGTFHTDWAERMANGENSDLAALAAIAKSAPDNLPPLVAGPLLTPYVPSKRLLNNVVNLGFKKVLSPILGRYDWPGVFAPFNHQRDTAAFLTLHKRAFCLNAMGTGKTSAVAWAADYLLSINAIQRRSEEHTSELQSH